MDVAKVHIERPTLGGMDEWVVLMMAGEWRTFCGLVIDGDKMYMDIDHLERGVGERCDEYRKNLCGKCEKAYEKGKGKGEW